MIFPGAGVECGAGSRMGKGPRAFLYPANPPSLVCACSLFIFNGGYWARVWAGTPGTEAPAAGGLTNGGERVSRGGEGGSQPTRGLAQGRKCPIWGSGRKTGSRDCISGCLHWSPLATCAGSS